MANFKRKGPKSIRGGCLCCKPHKCQGVNDEKSISKRGFGKLKALFNAKEDMKYE